MPPLTTWAPFCAVVLPMWTMLSPWTKQSHGCSCQGCKATNHTGTLRNLPNPASGTCQHAPELFGTLRNLPNSASETYTNTGRNSPVQNSPEPSESFRNQPPEPTPAYAGTSEIFRTCLRNLRQHDRAQAEIAQLVEACEVHPLLLQTHSLCHNQIRALLEACDVLRTSKSSIGGFSN